MAARNKLTWNNRNGLSKQTIQLDAYTSFVLISSSFCSQEDLLMILITQTTFAWQKRRIENLLNHNRPEAETPR